MVVAGLTGSIAMGKSTIAGMFAAFGCPVFDADFAVKQIYESDSSALIEAAFPGVVSNGIVDRERLASRALTDSAAMSRLEAIVHPAVEAKKNQFLLDARNQGRHLTLLDIPLLFETGGDRSVDLAIVVSASLDNQRARALSRSNMTDAKFDSILARQIPDSEKRRRAHYVIDTDKSLVDCAAEVAGLVCAIAGLSGRGFNNARNRRRY